MFPQFLDVEDQHQKSQKGDFHQTVTEDLMKDRSKWGYPDQFEYYKGQGFTEDKALEMSQKLMVLKEMDAQIRSAYKDQKVEKRRDGWYVEGKLVQRNPYGRKQL